jgi:hypothetical protein
MMANDGPHQFSNNHHSALRAILRLKAGLAPLDRLEELTVNRARHFDYLSSLLSTAKSESHAFGIVLGPYGSGKSHFLQLAKQFALNHKFAVAQLNLDTGVASLSHPQRHVSSILSTLTAPPPWGSLLEWVGTVFDDPVESLSIEDHLRSKLNQYRSIGNTADEILAIVDSSPREQRSVRIVEHLSGGLLVGYSAHTRARLRAYELLQFWAKLCRDYLGCAGLVLLLDEMENLFSGAVYWNILSRRTALRTLGYYSSNLKPAAIVCALTPDGWDQFRDEIKVRKDYFINYWSRLESENIPKLLTTILKCDPHELFVFNQRTYGMLAMQLESIHAEARRYHQASLSRSFATAFSSPSMTPRIFAKSVVSALEANWLTMEQAATEI